MMQRERQKTLSKSAATGTVALIFLVLGFQLALFVVKVVERPPREVVPQDEAPRHDAPGGAELVADTARGEPVEVRSYSSGRSSGRQRAAPRKSSLGGYEAPEKPSYSRSRGRKVESFRFDPNTVTVEDLQRLGFSGSQAEVIHRYRDKGGRFRRREDFKKMYVVSDSLYKRLEQYIDIPKIELNAADSAALVSLPGIGPWYAAKIIEYRNSLGGFYSPRQLMEVRGIDEERFAGLEDRVSVDNSVIRRLRIDILPEDSLAAHPYIGKSRARSLIRYRKVYEGRRLAAEDLLRENVFDSATFRRLRPYLDLPEKEPSDASEDVEAVPERQDKVLERAVGNHGIVEFADTLRLDVTGVSPDFSVPEDVVGDDVTSFPDFVTQQFEIFGILFLGRVDIDQVVGLFEGGDDAPCVAENEPYAFFEACAAESFAYQVLKFVIDLDGVEAAAGRKSGSQADGRITGESAEFEDARRLHHPRESFKQAACLRPG